MFKSKSFDLVNEEKTKKPERLYQPRRMRWLKYIILPAVFAFVLLLILVNVDFSDNSEEVATSSTSLGMHFGDYAWELDTTEAIPSGKRSYPKHFPMADDPLLSGVTTTEEIVTPPTSVMPPTSYPSFSDTTGTTTENYSSSISSTTSTSTTYTTTSAPSIIPPSTTIPTTTEPQNCEKELCQEYVCTVPQGESAAISMPYGMILKFKNPISYSVQVAISECELSQTRIIYFTNNSLIESVDHESLDEILNNLTSGLDCEPAYIYCVKIGEAATSGPPCLPHRTMTCEVYTSQTESWFDVHGGLIIGVGVAAILISTLLGMIIVYVTLRMKPSLLRGNKQQIRPSRDSNSVGLIPQESEKNEYGIARGPISTLDNNEYIVAYHRYLERANLRHMESNKYISPPRERAPSVPPSCDSHSSLPLPLPARNNYVYESLDLYEELP